MKFCVDCGARVRLLSVEEKQRQRYVCTDCERIHYHNPTVVVAVYVCCNDRMMWIRRGIEPAKGKWAIPGGFMEAGESPESAASRELEEETGVVIPPDDLILVSVSTIIHMTQTHLVFRCHLASEASARLSDEASEICWFGIDDLPWADLAFGVIEPQIREVYRWLDSGDFGIRVGVVDQTSSHYKNYPLAR